MSDNISKNYPKWAKKPFRLTIEELENPHLVLDDFFSWYSLLEVREHLRDILFDALTVENAPAGDYCFFFEYVERLTEAASVMWEKKYEADPTQHDNSD